MESDGPCLYIAMESALNPLSRFNIFINFADDTNLLFSEHTVSILTHICDWAQQNAMCINITKTMELVCHMPHLIFHLQNLIRSSVNILC